MINLIESPAKLHFRRFEFKYHLPRAIADRILPELMNYMIWDEYAEGDDGYEVTSLYMDSSDFACFHDKLDGVLTRRKLRVRSYGKGDDVFFELKRRSGEVILKDRIIVGADAFADFVNDPFSLKGDEDFVNEFLYEFSSNNMKPSLLVNYKRKPFFSKFDPRFRVTFDYDLSFARPQGASFDGEYQVAYDDLVIMEVKFNGAMPRWFHHAVVEDYGLRKDTFSKYCAGIEDRYGIPSYF